MTEAAARFVTSPDATAPLDSAAAILAERGEPALLLPRLYPELPADWIRAVLAVAQGRDLARRRGMPEAERWFGTRETLAQATSPALAAFHATRLAPWQDVVDLCGGAGVDAIALARAGAQVTSIEADPARLWLAHANAQAAGVGQRIRFLCGDVRVVSWSAPAVFFDPARRSVEGRRVSRDGDRYEPPLAYWDLVRAKVQAGIAKLSPLLPDHTLAALGEAVTFLSEGRECREACVLTGEAAQGFPPVSAVLLPEGILLAGGEPLPLASAPEPGGFLLDPDPALVRAGALGALCRQTAASPISPDDAYLTTKTPPSPRLARAYRVTAVMPYRPKILAPWLRAQAIGRLIVKKRHFPREPADICRDLGMRGGGNEAVLVLVALGRGHLAVVTESVQ